jgi:hypothetical protein
MGKRCIMGEKIQRIGRLLFGTLDWRRMASLITPGIGAGILVWLIYDGALWQRSIVALLTIDLVAGALSNATPQTNAAWRRLMRWHRWLFVAVHVCLYPLVLWLLMAAHELFWVMLMILTIKMMFFVRGTLWRVA